MIEHNIHHARFPRVLHTADKVNEAIREHPNNKFHMLVEPHNDLHRNVIYTPPFPYEIGHRVLKNLHVGVDAEDKIDIFVETVEKALRMPRTTRLDRQLGSLAIDSLLAQAPYLIQGEYRREI